MIRSRFRRPAEEGFSLGMDRLRESRIRPSTTDEGSDLATIKNEHLRLALFLWCIITLLACSALCAFVSRERRVLSVMACSIKGDVKKILLPRPEGVEISATSSPSY
jgi:hypothetical protein